MVALTLGLTAGCSPHMRTYSVSIAAAAAAIPPSIKAVARGVAKMVSEGGCRNSAAEAARASTGTRIV